MKTVIKLVFSIYDSKADAFAQPFIMPTAEMAKRSVINAARDSNTMLNEFPGDYTLFEIGEWDEDEGIFIMYEAKQNLGTVLQLSVNSNQRSLREMELNANEDDYRSIIEAAKQEAS